MPHVAEPAMPLELVDLADWPCERTAAYAEILDTHLLRSGTDKCGICAVTTPCPMRMDAQTQLYRIGYLRSTLKRHSLRDLADHVRWMREEIAKRTDYAATHPEQADRMLADIPRFQAQVEAEEAQLLVDAAKHFPDLTDELPARAAGQRRTRSEKA